MQPFSRVGIEFRWLRQGVIAGASQPGLLGDISSDLAELERQGIRLLVTLTEDPLALDERRFAFRQMHFPISDMAIPAHRETEVLCREIQESIQRAEPVALHCKAGLGRTGLLLACFLVTEGIEPEEAIAEVRRSCTYYIQNSLQEMFVYHYAEFLAHPRGVAGDHGLPPLRLPSDVKGRRR